MRECEFAPEKEDGRGTTSSPNRFFAQPAEQGVPSETPAPIAQPAPAEKVTGKTGKKTPDHLT